MSELPSAEITISIADGRLRAAVRRAIDGVLARATTPDAGQWRVVRLRTRKRLAALTEAEALRDAIVVVRVTADNARRLPAIVAGARSAGAAGVQLVWNGVDPARSQVERGIFAALESARATPTAAPVVLATRARPVPALLVLIARLCPKGGRQPEERTTR
jgi:hypothetical protein